MPDVIAFDIEQRRAEAKELAIRILDFIGRDEDRLKRFLKSTRLNKDEVRESAKATTLFDVGVIDHALKDPKTVAELAAAEVAKEPEMQAAAAVLAPEPRPAKTVKAAPVKRVREPGPDLPRRSLYI